MVWAAFFARVSPVSTSAKPACMNMTRNPVTSVHTMLIDSDSSFALGEGDMGSGPPRRPLPPIM